MTKFSTEEVAVAKQLHELGVRREIEYGDWYVRKVGNKEPLFICNSHTYDMQEWISEQKHPEIYWQLWQIHDCISWIREKRFYLRINTMGEYWAVLAYQNRFNEKDEEISVRLFSQEKTLSEGLMKAMIAIAKEDKNG